MLQTPKTLATSALIPFVPRQVMLDSKSSFTIDIKIKEVESKIKEKEMERERKKKKKKSKSSKQSETLENGSIDPKTLTVDDAGAKGKSRQMLLISIAAFLESNGFHKTLAVFRSETQFEDDGLKVSSIDSIDFEGLFYKFMESSRNPEEAAINCEKDKDSQKTDAFRREEIEHVQKKRRKHKKEPDDGTNPSVEEHSSNKNSKGPNNLGNSDDLEKLKSAEDLHVGMKDMKKKKKKKSLSESLEEIADKDDLEISAGVANESDKNDKSKKKKKFEMSSDGCDGNNGFKDHTEKFQEIVEEKIAELKSLTNMSSSLPAESNVKHKGEKKMKKKTEATSGSLDVKGNKSTEEALKESDSVKEKTVKSETGDCFEKKAHKKRKRLDSDGVSQDDHATMAKESKHVRLEGAENNKECGTPHKPDMSLPDNEQTTVCKKRETEKNSENSDKAGKTSHQEQDLSGQSVQRESGKIQLGNGELEKSGKERGTASKSQKKEKCSAEPKSVNAFQRVKIDEVKFADERLQDNSYWALDDTGSGYGAKAQEVLGQVRGRDFRHEKTKKKKGTYRGGQIDLQSHSIKFNYSDEE